MIVGLTAAPDSFFPDDSGELTPLTLQLLLLRPNTPDNQDDYDILEVAAAKAATSSDGTESSCT